MKNIIKSIVAISVLTISSGAFAQLIDHRPPYQGSSMVPSVSKKQTTTATFTILTEKHSFDDNTYTFEGNFTYTVNGVAKVCNLENIGVGLAGSSVTICEDGDIYTDLYIKTTTSEKGTTARLYIAIKEDVWGSDPTLVKVYHDLGKIPAQERKEHYNDAIIGPK